MRFAMVVVQTIDGAMMSIVEYKQQGGDEEGEDGKKEEEVEKQETVELPRPS